MSDIDTTFTIETVQFINGPYMPANIGEVVDIAAGTTSTSELGYPPDPTPPEPGTAIPLDTWVHLTTSGSNYAVETAADAAGTAGAVLTATAGSLAWSITNTGVVNDITVVIAPHDVIPSGGAPFTLTFNLTMPGDAGRATDWFLDFNLYACATNPGDHIAGTFPTSDLSSSILDFYGYRFIGTSPASDLQQVGATPGTLDVTGTVAIKIEVTATEVKLSFNGSVFYTNTGISASSFPSGALLTMLMEWDSAAGSTAYGGVLGDMRWTAP